MSFAEEFRNMRLENLMSQETIAHKLGVVRNTVSRWETGRKLPVLSFMPTLLKFCDEVGYDGQLLCKSWMEEKKR